MRGGIVVFFCSPVSHYFRVGRYIYMGRYSRELRIQYLPTGLSMKFGGDRTLSSWDTA